MSAPHHTGGGGFRDHMLFAAVAVLLLAMQGCMQRESDEPRHEATELQLFEQGKGVRLPEEMQHELGIQTVEVQEKPLVPRVEGLATVIRAASESKPAVAMAFLDKAAASGLRLGQTVLLRHDTSQQEFTGTLRSLDTRLTNLLGRGEVTIEFADPAGQFPVASTLMAIFSAAHPNSVPAVPVAAVLTGVEGAFVYTVSGSHFIRTTVRTGAHNEAWIEIVDGLYPGDAVVAKGADRLWLIELCALKGGSPCCPVARKPSRSGD